TARLISFVSEVCSDLDLEMIGEGIETEEDKQLMLDLGCKIGQGYLMHRPDFLDSFKPKET
ncbi:EAL domain-containing protein, partial [Gammaproteobacteria bacterium]|nr:EAL domain-containing protein [Gammaproteobacteria bacterium]